MVLWSVTDGLTASISGMSLFLFSTRELLHCGWFNILRNVSLTVEDCAADLPDSNSLIGGYFILNSNAALSKTAKYVHDNLIRNNGMFSLTKSNFLGCPYLAGELRELLLSCSMGIPYASLRYYLIELMDTWFVDRNIRYRLQWMQHRIL